MFKKRRGIKPIQNLSNVEQEKVSSTPQITEKPHRSIEGFIIQKKEPEKIVREEIKQETAPVVQAPPKNKFQKIIRSIKRFFGHAIDIIISMLADKKKRWIIFGIVIVIVLGIIYLVLNRFVIAPKVMDGKLEDFASQVFEENLKTGTSQSYTINLDYLERHGYDVSIFNSNNCDRSETYVIVTVGADRNIISITPNQKCN